MSLLRTLGYTKVRHYRGGMADWQKTEGLVERSAVPPPTAGPAVRLPEPPQKRPRSRPVHISYCWQWGHAVLDWSDRLSTFQLFLAWLGMIVLCGVVYWFAGLSRHHGLVAGGAPVDMSLRGLATALYFSFVTE